MATLAEARLRACKLWPYGSHAVLSLTPVARPGLGSMAVDRRWRVYYDPQALAGWTADEAAGVVLHELAHLLFKHYARAPQFLGGLAGDREFDRWNIATDLAINDMLAKEGVPLPEGVLYPDGFGFEHRLSAEAYYRLLEALDEQQSTEAPQDDAGGEDGQGAEQPSDAAERGDGTEGDYDSPQSAGSDEAASSSAEATSDCPVDIDTDDPLLRPPHQQRVPRPRSHNRQPIRPPYPKVLRIAVRTQPDDHLAAVAVQPRACRA